jgi:RsiW-degrading membrane proteinase PrsW (M82 family)
MAIEFRCTCGKLVKAPATAAGKKGRCPQCQAVIVIPAQSSAQPHSPAIEPAVTTTHQQPAPTSAQADAPAPTIKPQAASASAAANPADNFFDDDDFKLAPLPADVVPREPVAASKWADEDDQFRIGSHAVAPRSLVKPAPHPAAHPALAPSQSFGLREYLYIALCFGLIPLGIYTFQTRPTLEDEVVATVRDYPDQKEAIAHKLDHVKSEDEFFDAFPENKLHDALLPRRTHLHWLFALCSAGLFCALVWGLFPSARTKRHAVLAGTLFTATVGIVVLLSIQFAAELTNGHIVYGGSVLVIVFWIVKFIGFSYSCAQDPNNSFLVSFFGFTMGVGLCEEFVKAMPLIIRFKHLESPEREPANTWQAACLWGIASGVGFGVAEGIMYSADYYNGISGGMTYAVRFLSCVALHAIWAGSVGITMFNRQAALDAADTWYNFLFEVVICTGAAMTLHGLYDTFSKKEMEPFAFGVAIVSFAWLAIQVESMRSRDVLPSPRVRMAV